MVWGNNEALNIVLSKNLTLRWLLTLRWRGRPCGRPCKLGGRVGYVEVGAAGLSPFFL
jgi:hypothetical protein